MKFINRELSFLDFNRRVLYRTTDKYIPLNDKLKFLAITESNLDEFLSVRFAGVYNEEIDADYNQLLKKIRKFKDDQQKSLATLINLLNNCKLRLSRVSQVSKKERDDIYEYYTNHIFPLLTPISVSSVDEIPHIQSGQLCIAVEIDDDDIVIVPIDPSTSFIYKKDNRIFTIEDIIISFMGSSLFINKRIGGHAIFRIIRDYSQVLSHDNNKFIIDRMKDILNERTHSLPIFMDISCDSQEKFIDILTSIFQVPEKHVFSNGKLIYLKRFMTPLLDESKFSYSNFEPFEYENGKNYYDIFEALDGEDILLHHPYDSYNIVIDFINHAADDKDVVSIKQTLYRVSGLDSPIVNALCRASKNGKSVTCLVEIKARFDESNNLALISKLKNSGVNVLLGFEELKTHCKMCIVVRKSKDNKINVYSHLGTGNYNEKTARLYTDLSYLTSKKKIGIDLLHVFNILSGNSNPDQKLEKIFYAPVTLRKNIVKCINREISNAKKGKPAQIFMKVNSLSDIKMVDKLNEAADKGVNIFILCRGVCSLTPRKNIFIKSIVGRFLEHSRIYYFQNNKSPEYYISSADLLTRNLDKRIEVMVSLKDSNVTDLLDWIINVFKQDNRNSFVMKSDGSWEQEKGDFSSHDWFIRYSNIKKQKKSWRKKVKRK